MLAKKIIIRILKTILLPAAVYIIFLIMSPDRFGSLNSMYIIFLQSIIPSLIGWGMCFGLVGGIIDISAGSRIIISSMLGGILAAKFGLPGLVIGCIVAGIALGIFTGALYILLRIPSLILGLGLLMVFEVVGSKIAGTAGLISLTGDQIILGYVPYNVIIGVISFILFYTLYYHTKFSYEIKAIGGDEMIARDMGVNVRKAKFFIYIVGSIFMGIASILQISYARTIAAKLNLGSLSLVFQPLMGLIIGLELQSICNLAVGIFIGQFTMSMIFTGLISMGLPATMQNVALGAFLLIVLSIAANRGGMQGLIKKSRLLLRKKRS